MKTIVLRGEIASFTIWGKNVFSLHQSSIKELVLEGKIGKATISTMPIEDIEIVNNLTDGFEITTRIINKGPMDNINSGIEFVRLGNCKILRKWFEDLTINNPMDSETALTLNWQVEGNLQINWPKRGA